MGHLIIYALLSAIVISVIILFTLSELVLVSFSSYQDTSEALGSYVFPQLDLD